MSRLWNKLQAQVWPAPHACIGIELAGERLIAIHTELMGAVWNVTHVVEEYLPFVPFRGAPRAEETSALAQALERLAGSQHQTQLPIQFALPGAVVWEFDLATERVSREYLIGLMTEFVGNVTEAAKRAGMERESLHRLLKRYGVRTEQFKR